MMKFELKTEQSNFYNHLSLTSIVAFLTIFVIGLTNISLNLSKISKFNEINYLCKLILVDKSSANFKRLSNLTKLSNRQKIWDLCREISN